MKVRLTFTKEEVSLLAECVKHEVARTVVEMKASRGQSTACYAAASDRFLAVESLTIRLQELTRNLS